MTNEIDECELLTRMPRLPFGWSAESKSIARADIGLLSRNLAEPIRPSWFHMPNMRITSAPIELGKYQMSASVLTVRPQGMRYKPVYSHILVLESREECDEPDYDMMAHAVSIIDPEISLGVTDWMPFEPISSSDRSGPRWTPLHMAPDEHRGLAITLSDYSLRDLSQYVISDTPLRLVQQVDYVDERFSESYSMRWSLPLSFKGAITNRAGEAIEWYHVAENKGLGLTQCGSSIVAEDVFECSNDHEVRKWKGRYTSTLAADRTFEPQVRSCWDILESDNFAAEQRIAAIEECVFDDESRMATFVAHELGEDQLQECWRNALVEAAEVVDFTDPKERRVVTDSLLRIAVALHESGGARQERVLWSALRTFASMIAPEQVVELVPFLVQGVGAESRLVALQAICTVLEQESPTWRTEYQTLADRAYGIAKKHLDPDVFVDGYSAAVAQAAVKALAVLCDSRILTLVKTSVSSTPVWFREQLRDSLVTITATWTRKPTGDGSCAAEEHDMILRAIAELGV